MMHARERGVLFAPGRYFYVQSPLPNTLRLGFASLNEKQISRGIATLSENVPVDRIVFGSYFPVFNFESALLKLQESPLPGRLERDIRAGNARRLLPVP